MKVKCCSSCRTIFNWWDRWRKGGMCCCKHSYMIDTATNEVCKMIQEEFITMSKGKQILGISLMEMREMFNEWVKG